MNKKIKVIDLVAKIANEGPLPKRIKYDRFIWILGKTASKNTDYQMEGNPEQFLFSNYILSILVECLNDEVEILEDNTEEIEELTYYCIGNAKSTDQTKMIDKINELVRIVNSIRKNIDKEYCCCCGVEITDENRALHNMCNECKYGIDWEEKTK